MHLTTDLGDHIGMESCVDLETDSATPTPTPLSSAADRSVSRKPWGTIRRSSTMSVSKKLPPPLPIQTLTIMRRYYTDDRRLIIKEEKVETPKYYFTAHRSNGRLTMQLVSSDDDTDDEENEVLEVDDDEYSGGKVPVTDGGNRRCFGYNAVARVAATGSCLFVNQNQQLHTIRPVQI